jgi:hypothetical protein
VGFFQLGGAQGRPSDLALKKFKSYWEKQILMRILNVAQVDLKAPTLIFFLISLIFPVPPHA